MTLPTVGCRRPRCRNSGDPLPKGACLLRQLFACFNGNARHGNNGQCVPEAIEDVAETGNGRAGWLAPGPVRGLPGTLTLPQLDQLLGCLTASRFRLIPLAYTRTAAVIRVREDRRTETLILGHLLLLLGSQRLSRRKSARSQCKREGNQHNRGAHPGRPLLLRFSC
jgi:hypothetical protein